MNLAELGSKIENWIQMVQCQTRLNTAVRIGSLKKVISMKSLLQRVSNQYISNADILVFLDIKITDKFIAYFATSPNNSVN
jgi:hypothetical protein